MKRIFIAVVLLFAINGIAAAQTSDAKMTVKQEQAPKKGTGKKHTGKKHTGKKHHHRHHKAK